MIAAEAKSHSLRSLRLGARCRNIRGRWRAGFRWRCLTSCSAMDWRSRCASANRPNPAARTSRPLAPSISAIIRTPAFGEALDMGSHPRVGFRRLYRPTLLGNDLRRIHQVLGQKPYLEFISSNDATDKQVVRSVMAKGGCFPRSRPRFLEDDLVGGQQP